MNLGVTKEEIARRFMRYASVCTQSEEGVPDTPSTACQRDLASMLYGELLEMGASDVYYDEEKCYVYATVPGNLPANQAKLDSRADKEEKRRENTAPIIAFIAHMDTSNAVPATVFRPRLIEKYDGGKIVLDGQAGIVSDPKEMPDLAKHKGKMLVVTDGHSVLGGDDKAGVTEIMETAYFYLHHPEYAHATMRILFTPDEEVGNGPMHADLHRLAADYGYTIDGGDVGQIEYENFNAATADVTFHGVSTHTGDAKGKMRNASLMAMEYDRLLPAGQRPQDTEGYEGFYHLDELAGTVESARAVYLIRDHDREKFEDRKRIMKEAADRLGQKYGEGSVSIKITDSYYNMAEKIRPHMHLVEVARQAIQKAGAVAVTEPIRGGTDGCRFSFEGLPCPNLGTGAYHYHSRYEYVCVDEMAQAVEIAIRILNSYAGYELDE